MRLMELVGRNWREVLLFHLRVGVMLGMLCTFQHAATNTTDTINSALVPTAYAWLLLGLMCLLANVLTGVGSWWRATSTAADAPPPRSLCAHIWVQIRPSKYALLGNDDHNEEEEEEPATTATTHDEEEEEEAPPMVRVWYTQGANKKTNHRHRPLLSTVGFYSFRHAMWSCMSACGIALFVVSYSIVGRFWLPQTAFMAAVLLALAHQLPSGGLKRWGLWALLGALGLWWLDLHVLNPTTATSNNNNNEPLLLHHLWLGMLLPAFMGWMLISHWHIATTTTVTAPADAPTTPYGVYYHQEEEPGGQHLKQQRRLHTQSILSFAMPSLVLISLTYLSLHFPTQQCVLELELLDQQQQQQATIITNTTTTTTTTNSSSSLLFLKELMLNATQVYYGMLSSPSNVLGVASMVPPATLSGTCALLLAPSLLWVSLTIMLGATLRTPSSACSTIGAYVLAMLLQAMLPMRLSHVALYPALLLCKWGVANVLYAELVELEDFRCDRFQQALHYTDALAQTPTATAAAAAATVDC